MKIILVSLFMSASSFAATECTSDASCKDPQRCVKVEKKRVCATPCDPKAAKCPTGERCVKDAPSYICKPMIDAPTL